MSENFSQSVFAPFIPRHLLTVEDHSVFKAFGITIEPVRDDKFYLYADGWCDNTHRGETTGESVELNEDDLYARFQEVIRRSNGGLPWISQETAYTGNNNMRPEDFGGSAVFITSDGIQYTGTSTWLQQRIAEAETGDFGPGSEDISDANASLPTIDKLSVEVETERQRKNEVVILEGLWKELRTKDHGTAPEVMGHLSIIIGEKRGDPGKSSCGCGGKVGHYDGAIGYEAMVCKACGQHYTLI